jgi:hypothetical protein
MPPIADAPRRGSHGAGSVLRRAYATTHPAALQDGDPYTKATFDRGWKDAMRAVNELSVHRYLVELMDIDKGDRPIPALADAWAGISEAQVTDIKRTYGVTHRLIPDAKPFGFPVVYSHNGYVIYDVRTPPLSAS